MCLPRLDSCCCVCTTKTGTKAILWLSLIGCIWFLFADIGTTTPHEEQGQAPSPPHPTTDIATIWTIIDYIIGIVICTIALCGVGKGLHSCLVPYLVWIWIDFIIGAVFPSPNVRDDDVVVPIIWIGFFLYCYFWLVVYSHYRDLKKPQSGPSFV